MTAPARETGSIVAAPDRAELEARLREGGFFWLDLLRPGPDEFALLRELFGFHPLALEDSDHFGQRPKLEDYDDVLFLVVYGAALDDDLLVEVHCFCSERFLVTVRVDEFEPFARLRQRLRPRTRPSLVLHAVADALIDSFFPVLSSLDDRIEGLEESVFDEPSDEQLREIFELRRRVLALRKVVGPQRDVFATITNQFAALPSMDVDAQRAFRDVYDHLIRIGDMLDSHRDLLTGALDVYLSRASNRLSEVTKQLALIATIFLPLTFVTGFFGQNFDWLVDHVGGSGAFFAYGIGVQVLTLALLLVFFRRRGWF